MRSIHRGILLCLGLLATTPAFAWGPLGHRIVADLADAQLAPGARAQVDALLASEHMQSMADIANWADTLRDDPAQAALGKATAPLHYVNMHGSCDYKPAFDCPDGQCVVAAITHYAAILGNRSLPEAERAQALNFVVHFVGDVNQPLHAGYQQDRGANDYQVQFEGQGSNLHRVWDSGLLSTRHLDALDYTALLQKQGPVTLPAPIAPLDNPPAQWAEESCKVVMNEGVYPQGHVIGQSYIERERPIAERQLRIAGKRLADLLNRVLGDSRTVSTPR
ncbi:endonuclease [mine drainage metagenome]|uniref:Endonuclease n=2 Tax=mine drainage metagenome TaxID=410659 RepID=T0YQ87_9ZZZZ